MARWLGPLDQEQAHALDRLFRELNSLKPAGWSVVKGENDVVIRPRDRCLGKFALTPSVDQTYRVAFFSADLGRWTWSRSFSHGLDTAAAIVQWMLSYVE